MNADQKAMKKALDNITADFVTAKDAYVADPSSENFDARRAQAKQLRAAREVWRQNRPPTPLDPAVFQSSDAEAFLPKDQGGDTVRALSLLTQLFAERGDTDDPATVLAEMRAAVIANRSY
jgi:hypothetical protein